MGSIDTSQVLVPWPVYEKNEKNYLVLTEKPHVESNYKPDRMEFWNLKAKALADQFLPSKC